MVGIPVEIEAQYFHRSSKGIKGRWKALDAQNGVTNKPFGYIETEKGGTCIFYFWRSNALFLKLSTKTKLIIIHTTRQFFVNANNGRLSIYCSLRRRTGLRKISLFWANRPGRRQKPG
jgi:hypothetical protein